MPDERAQDKSVYSQIIEDSLEKGRVRHGSPIFYSLLSEMADTHDRKSHDYASNDNPFGNYHFAGKLALLFAHSPEDAGFAGRLGEKLFRIANLEAGNKTPANESIEDTERDIAVIATLWMADRRQRRLTRQKNIDAVRAQMAKGEWSGIMPQAETADPLTHTTGQGQQYKSELSSEHRHRD
jgi:hypothetical protein